jgi:hypothetical protein
MTTTGCRALAGGSPPPTSRHEGRVDLRSEQAERIGAPPGLVERQERVFAAEPLEGDVAIEVLVGRTSRPDDYPEKLISIEERDIVSAAIALAKEKGEIRRGDRLVAWVGSAGMSFSVCSFLL